MKVDWLKDFSIKKYAHTVYTWHASRWMAFSVCMLYSYIKVKVNGGNNWREACTCSQFTVMFITDESIPTEVKVENISELVYNA